MVNEDVRSGPTREVLERDSPVAVYQQVADVLTDQVSRLEPGSRIPTEESLMDEYGISRTTVRKAIETLVVKGLLVRRQGKGTFVMAQRPVKMLNRLAPFMETFTAAGMKTVKGLIEYKWMEKDRTVPAKLVSDDNLVLVIRRSYSSAGWPYAIAEIFIPSHIGRHISLADAERNSIYQVIQDRTLKPLQRAEITVTMHEPPEHLADALNVRGFAMVPRLERTTLGAHGEVLECTVTYFHPKGFEIRAEVATDVSPGQDSAAVPHSGQQAP
ncbi:GntR family transcriptional regulator [Paenarthrobacter nicotinovorans]|uniref:GntR family transcriptional regulator n=1 Tax=Micrococcaceae TaxID=1268 RepID=UPI000876AC6C|nr:MULTISPECIES: GntR family transcriptional regulator [Micrococcaceae]MDR6435768.1 GntR family transcriptional regulator [Paenarthrobacter nicotinovorans]BCW59500.1 GntR family transcriptional regulator [Arthrobacter sp. StoSoilB20]SCZ50663.1 GntR family transcriptional regulator [Arthrobacter sp. UNCCL28]